MFEVKLTIGFNPEAVALLTAIIGGAKPVSAPAAEAPSVKNGKAVRVEKQTAHVNGHAEEKEEVEESGDTATKVVTLEMARAAVVKKTQAGFRDEVKKLLGEYDVTKVTDLAAQHYAEFLTKVEALK
jgi:hypothetical protein